jgi:hypothetical protein
LGVVAYRRVGPVWDIVIVAQHFSAGFGSKKTRPSISDG